MGEPSNTRPSKKNKVILRGQARGLTIFEGFEEAFEMPWKDMKEKNNATSAVGLGVSSTFVTFRSPHHALDLSKLWPEEFWPGPGKPKYHHDLKRIVEAFQFAEEQSKELPLQYIRKEFRGKLDAGEIVKLWKLAEKGDEAARKKMLSMLDIRKFRRDFARKWNQMVAYYFGKGGKLPPGISNLRFEMCVFKYAPPQGTSGPAKYSSPELHAIYEEVGELTPQGTQRVTKMSVNLGPTGSQGEKGPLNWIKVLTDEELAKKGYRKFGPFWQDLLQPSDLTHMIKGVERARWIKYSCVETMKGGISAAAPMIILSGVVGAIEGWQKDGFAGAVKGFFKSAYDSVASVQGAAVIGWAMAETSLKTIAIRIGAKTLARAIPVVGWVLFAIDIGFMIADAELEAEQERLRKQGLFFTPNSYYAESKEKDYTVKCRGLQYVVVDNSDSGLPFEEKERGIRVEFKDGTVMEFAEEVVGPAPVKGGGYHCWWVPEFIVRELPELPQKMDHIREGDFERGFQKTSWGYYVLKDPRYFFPPDSSGNSSFPEPWYVGGSYENNKCSKPDCNGHSLPTDRHLKEEGFFSNEYYESYASRVRKKWFRDNVGKESPPTYKVWDVSSGREPMDIKREVTMTDEEVGKYIWAKWREKYKTRWQMTRSPDGSVTYWWQDYKGREHFRVINDESEGENNALRAKLESELGASPPLLEETAESQEDES